MTRKLQQRSFLRPLLVCLGFSLGYAGNLLAVEFTAEKSSASFFARASESASFYVVGASGASGGEPGWRKGQSPRPREGSIEFRYWDREFGQVYIAGEFNDWKQEPLRLNGEAGYWLISLDIGPGTHRYHFIVDEDEETWTALDPGNSKTERDGVHGWVSLITLDEDGVIVSIDRDDHVERIKEIRPWKGDWDDDGDDDWGEDWGRSWGDDWGDNWGDGWSGNCGIWGADDDDFGWMSYQRVDGLSLGLSPSFDSHHDFEPSIDTYFSYGFKSEEWSYGGSIFQPVSPYRAFQLKLSGYSKTDHNKQIGICTDENSMAAIFFKQDYRDYFRREGFSVGAVFEEFGWLAARGGLRFDDYFTLENQADWSFDDGEFRVNPPIDEGNMRSVFADLRLGTRLNNISLQYEVSNEDLLEGDYDFQQLTAQIRARLNLRHNPHIDFRLKVGKNFAGTLPAQKRYFVGGLGTVRGYPFQSLLHEGSPPASGAAGQQWGGEQMLVANVEYVFDFFGDLEGMLTFDTGMAWTDRDASMDLGDLKSSAGVGIQLDDGALRLHLAQRLDDGDHDPVVSFRVINRMF
jgi:hypothetical protein